MRLQVLYNLARPAREGADRKKGTKSSVAKEVRERAPRNAKTASPDNSPCGVALGGRDSGPLCILKVIHLRTNYSFPIEIGLLLAS